MAISQPLVWKGSFNNQVSNPQSWSPNQEPQPGDTLFVFSNFGQPGGPSLGSPDPSIINASGNDLRGDLLTITTIKTTLNLTNEATANVQVNSGSSTFNLRQHSTLNINPDHSSVTINLQETSIANLNPGFQVSATINVDDPSATLKLLPDQGATSVTVNFAPHSSLKGSFTAPTGGLTMIGTGGNDRFDLTGKSFDGTKVVFNVDVSGDRADTLAVSGRLEFMQSVEASVPIIDGGLVIIDRPDAFDGKITLQAAQPRAPVPEIDLVGLATADSYTFKNDMLNIYSGNKVIDTLRMHDNTRNGFAVVKTAGSVNIVAITDPANPPAGLPIHV